MHRMPSQIELYEEMSLLSSRMVAAARAGDWDNLIELEHGVTSLRNTLMATPEDCNAPATDVARRRNLIRHPVAATHKVIITGCLAMYGNLGWKLRFIRA